jgi:hypothetical protein
LRLSEDEQWLCSDHSLNFGAFFPDCPNCGRPDVLGFTGACAVPDLWRTITQGYPCTKPLYPFQIERSGHGHSLVNRLRYRS